MPTGVFKPNLYELNSADTSVKYFIESFAMTFSYRGPRGSFSFAGTEVRTAPSEFGEEVTVALPADPDVDYVTLTLLVPDVSLPEGRDQAVATLLIATTHHETIAGPAPGQLQGYEVVDLTGFARFVRQG